jgi:enoyl-CoA hydratase/carnithine racemase
MSVTETILFTQEEGIGRLVFNNVSRHNALGQKELTAIEASLTQLNSDTLVLLIHAQGDRTFCAGADLSQIQSGELSGDRFQSVTNQIAALPIPTIALINGNVFGGGVELALSCDFRIGVADTVMRVPAAAFGLCYPPDGIRRIVARLGVPVAKRILVAADELTADEMLRLGVVDKLVSAPGAMNAAMRLANQIAALAPLAVSSMLEIIGQVETGELDAKRAEELSALCSGSEDLREGLAARQERRHPNFKGH